MSSMHRISGRPSSGDGNALKKEAEGLATSVTSFTGAIVSSPFSECRRTVGDSR